MSKNTQVQQGNGIKRYVLHFNIDKTIVMRDLLGQNNTDYYVRNYI